MTPDDRLTEPIAEYQAAERALHEAAVAHVGAVAFAAGESTPGPRSELAKAARRYAAAVDAITRTLEAK